MENNDFERWYNALVDSPKIVMNELSQVPKLKGIYILWLEKDDQKKCLKVGQAGKRSGKGLRERLQFHKGQNPHNTVLAKHMKRDYQFGLQFGYDFRERKQRKDFLVNYCYFQVFALPTTEKNVRMGFERFLERRLEPRYSAVRRYEENEYPIEDKLLNGKDVKEMTTPLRRTQTPKFALKAWNDILDILKNKQIIRTLSRRNPNEIVKTSQDSIRVTSLETGKDRILLDSDFIYYLEILGEKGILNPKEDIEDSKFFKKSAIICATIAELPYVTCTTNPVILYLRS